MGNKKYAIMAIDLQKSFTEPGNPELTPANQKEVDNIATFLKDMPNIAKYIVTYEDGSKKDKDKHPDDRILDAVKGKKHVIFFKKDKPNAFEGGHEIKHGKERNFNLYKHLKDNGITDLIVVGLNQDACVLGTIRGAIEKGFHVTTSNDMVFNASQNDSGPKHQTGLGGRYSPDKFYIKQEKEKHLTIVESAKDIKKLIDDKTSALDIDTNKNNNEKTYFVLNDNNSYIIPAIESTIENNENPITIASITLEHESDDERSL